MKNERKKKTQKIVHETKLKKKNADPNAKGNMEIQNGNNTNAQLIYERVRMKT